MSIDVEEFKIEEKRLSDTHDWLENQISSMNDKNEHLFSKISAVKKEIGFKYNYELETLQNVYAMSNKTLHDYDEVIGQPYFARIDFAERLRFNESFYIGKIGLSDGKTGDEYVIDWRAPIADIYYSGTQGAVSYWAPDGNIEGKLNLKRKFIIKDTKLEQAFDEGIDQIILKTGENENALVDEFLNINLEEQSGSKLKDVVATIQKEQNSVIRAPITQPVIIQGAAGSGKTTVALHRVAYILFKYKDRLKGKDVLVVAPNKLFLDYISDVLPNLGVDEVIQKTYDEIALEILKISSKITTKDEKISRIIEGNDVAQIDLMKSSSKLKGSIVFKEILDRYIEYLEFKDFRHEDIMVYSYSLFTSIEVKDLFLHDISHLPLDGRKDEIKRYFKVKLPDRVLRINALIEFRYTKKINAIKMEYGDSIERRKILTQLYDERDEKKKSVKKEATKSLNAYFKSWKYDDPIKLYQELFSNKEIFDELVSTKIAAPLAAYVKEKLIESISNKLIDSDDLTPMLYLKLKVKGVEEKWKFHHIVLDEAQDYSYFQVSTLTNLSFNNSCTIVGDIGQSIYYFKGINNWETLLKDVFEGEGTLTQLTQSYRSTVEIVKLANKVLVKQDNFLKPAVPVLRHGMEPVIEEIEDDMEFCSRAETISDKVMKAGRTNCAIICKTSEECLAISKLINKKNSNKWHVLSDKNQNLKYEKIIIPSYMTKGLEFDCSIIYNCSNEKYSNNELDKKLLYVILTRALHMEYIYYKKQLTLLLK